MATVIVALPAEDDYVHKISSEKKPHLTLLYLGDHLDESNLESVVKYINHIAETSLCRFGLTVDRRGTLGDKGADVLFFEDGWQTKKLKEVIGYLLADDHISIAFNQVEEKFPKWTPHLTLGYPETPANEDDRDYPGIHWVNFDRIAIWTGDSEGPEFRLESRNYDLDELAMSDAASVGFDFVKTLSEVEFDDEKIVAHYGVKGMRWGKRRAEGPDGTVSGGSAKTSKERGAFRRGLTKLNTANSAAAAVINEGHNKLIFLPQAKRDEVAAFTSAAALGAAREINKSPKYNGKDLKTDPKLKAEYHREVKKAMIIVYQDALAKARVEAAADAIEAVIDARRQQIRMRANQNMARHADNPLMADELILEFEEDELGQMKSFKIVPSKPVKHEDDEDSLAHYGVKGMQWGVRRSDRTPTGVDLKTQPGRKVKAAGGKFEEPSEDAKRTATQKQVAKKSSTDALSNTELKQLVERMQLEANYDRLVQQQRGNAFVKKLLNEPKYRNQQVDTLSKISMPVRTGIGNVTSPGKTIKKTDLSGIGR